MRESERSPVERWLGIPVLFAWSETVSGPEETFGPPDEHLREALERELGEVPPESPSEPQGEPPSKKESDEREAEEDE